jgi:hypothetical protein
MRPPVHPLKTESARVDKLRRRPQGCGITRKSVFDSLVDIAGIVKGGFFLRKKPLHFPVSVKSRIETAVAHFK